MPINDYIFTNDSYNKTRNKIRFGNGIPRYLDLSEIRVLSEAGDNAITSLEHTILFSGLDSLFNVNLKKDIFFSKYDTISETWHKNLSNFLPSFKNEYKTGYIKNIIPEPVNFQADIAPSILYYKAFARGGGNNSWNNIQLCEAFATITTGNHTISSLERKKSIDTIYNPISLSTDWRNNNLIKNLHNVVVNGTVSPRKTRINQICKQNGIYIIAKTGTLREKDNKKNDNSGMLMFTLGEFDNTTNSFIKGKSYTCYLYLEEGSNIKFKLAEKLIEYLAVQISDNNSIKNPIINKVIPIPAYKRGSRPVYSSSEYRELSAILNEDSRELRNWAVNISSPFHGNFINQVCAIYDEVKDEWKYISDPLNNDFFAKPIETIHNNYAGDCDDFAILMASAVRNIGGETHVAIGCNNEGCHAWAEMKVTEFGNIDNLKKSIIDYYKKYRDHNLSIEDIKIRKDGNDYWLNLDWWSNPDHVGSEYFNSTKPVKYVW